MKIIESVEPPVFKPVTIVLETQGEVDFIYNLIGNVSPPHANKLFGVNTSVLYNLLEEYHKDDYTANTAITFEDN